MATMSKITYLNESPSNNHAVTVKKNNGKTTLFMCYFLGKVVIRKCSGKLKEVFKADTEEELIEKLQKAGYTYVHH